MLVEKVWASILNRLVDLKIDDPLVVLSTHPQGVLDLPTPARIEFRSDCRSPALDGHDVNVLVGVKEGETPIVVELSVELHRFHVERKSGEYAEEPHEYLARRIPVLGMPEHV